MPAMTEMLPALPDVIAEHAEWQIQQDAGVGVWTAVHRPTPTALHILVSHSLAGLAVKLGAATDGHREGHRP
jgi:hypothetical protein